MVGLPHETYSKPIDPASPCGDALDYDLSFIELEIAAKGKPGRQVGDCAVAPESPDWEVIDRLTRELSGQTKDLRVAVVAVRAALALHGIGGLRSSLEGIAIYVDDFWEGLHPRPDGDSPEDEIVRTNTLANLCDTEGLLGELRLIPLSRSKSHGNISLADWSAAQMAAGGGSESVEPDHITIELAFRDTPQDVLVSISAETALAVAALSRIQASIAQRIGATLAPNFQALDEALNRIGKIVSEYLAGPQALEEEADPALAASVTVDICTRNDIIHSLESICRWYRVNEPSSPVPALLERVKRLVSKDFLSLLLELAPNGAAEFRILAGLALEGEKSTI